MSQSTYIAGALLLGFILYLATKNRLVVYTAVLWSNPSNVAAPAPSAAASPNPSSIGFKLPSSIGTVLNLLPVISGE